MEAREATATGESCMRVDAIAKVTGRARYTDDYVMAGMCYAKYVRSPIAHGYAVSINDEQARSLPGVLAILPKMCLISHSLQLGMHGRGENKRDTADRALLTRHGFVTMVTPLPSSWPVMNSRQKKRRNWSALSGKNYPLSPPQKRRWLMTLNQSITAAIY